MIQTRPYRPGDADAFLPLYRECLAYYRVRKPSAAQEARIVGILDGQRHLSCLMAFDGDRPLGFATWVLTFPSGTDIALYMKELFVREEARGQGVGRALMAGLVHIAEDEGCCRFDWQTDMDNPDAQAFYARLEAPLYEKVTYRVKAGEYDAFLSRLGA
ncbi:MAG: GNAT family N-acetyltransferase [Pseudomonadota bacterium]